MALKADRAVYVTDIQYVSNATGEAGTVWTTLASQPTGRGVGQNINDAAPVALIATGTPASGTVVAGILLDSVVSIDLTRQFRNPGRTEQIVGENVCLLKDGWVRTNKITGTPTAGAPAYLGANGTIDVSQNNAIPAIGKFDGALGTDGFAKVVIKIA